MKELFVFNVKDEFCKLYKNKQSELFFIFNRIYKMKNSDKEYGYNLFCQISNFLDKDRISKIIKNKYKDKIMYSCNLNEHIINNLFLNEISILTVKNSNIRIESNIENPSFLEDLKDFNLNLFVCNFKDQEFFFISKTNQKMKS